MADHLQLHPDVALVPGPPPRLWDHRHGQLRRCDPPELAAVIAAFVRPRTEAGVVAQLAARPGADPDEVIADRIRRARRAGLLVAADDAPPRGDGLFGMPRRSLAEVLLDPPDIVAIGVPYDAGATSRPGSRDGPAALRDASGTCLQYQEHDGHATGAWDPVAGRRILAGVRMADVGDVTEVAPVRNGLVIDRVRQAVQQVATGGCVPVVLGGDHSVGLPVLAGQVRAHGPIGVIHIDAHPDRGVDPGGDWRAGVHHGNFLTWALRDERIEQVVQLGIRQRQPDPPPSDPRVRVWPGTTASAVPAAELLADLDPDLPWHVSFDVDALDPSVLSVTGTPVPGGFTAGQLAQVLTTIASQRRIVGVDVCELLPGGDVLAGLVPCDILVQLLAAAFG